MKRFYFFFSILLSTFLLHAQGPVAKVQVIHNSPSPTVDIYANGDLLLDDFAFRTATPYLDVPAGVEIDLAIAPDTSTSVESALVTFENIIFEENTAYVVTAAGVVGAAQTPFDLKIQENARETATVPDQVDILAFHGAPDAPPVDVDARTVGNLISGLSFGNYSDYLSVAPDVYYLDLRIAGTPNVLATFEADLSGLAGQSVTLFASGFAFGEPSFGLYAALADGTVVQLPVSPVARVQLIHNSPSPKVDIYANGDLLLDDFEFRTATPYLTLPAGVDIDIAVAPDTSTSAESALVVFENVMFENTKTYIVTAAGVVGAAQTPFDLVIKEDARETATAPDQVDFLAFHGSPDAPPVDVDARGVGNLLEGLSFGTYTEYLSVAPDVYYLDVRIAGTPNVLATFEADLSGLAGQTATLFASGFAFDQPGFGLFAALADGTVVQLPLAEVARVQIIHNSPSPTVDIYANGELFLDDFEFRTATPFTTLPAGEVINIGVALDNSTSVEDTLVNFAVTFENNRTYVVAADGIVGDDNFPFTLHVSDMGQEAAPADSLVSVAALHGSPGAPNVDIDARTVGTIISDLAYGEFTGYLDLDTALYYLDVRAAGDPNIVATFAADLSGLGGAATTVFASGILGSDPAFGLFAALADGTVVELPAVEVARVQIIHNSPSPTVDVYANGELFLDDFEFRTATPFTTLPAGEVINIGVALDNSTSVEDTLVNFAVTFENNRTYVVAADGIVGDDNFPFTLHVSDMGQEAAPADSLVSVAALHGSPGAPNVDIDARTVGTIISDLAYGEFTGYLDLDTALYYLDVRAAGDPNIVATFAADLSGLGGAATTVFASGILGSDPAFGLFAALADGTVVELPAVEVARVQVIHNSPSPTVDVYANGDLLLDDFAFRTATPFTTLPAGVNIDLGVALDNSSSVEDTLVNFPVMFENGKTYVVIATGIVGDMDTPFDLAVFDMGQEAAGDDTEVDLLLYHGSTDAPAVDVLVDGGGTLFDDVAYGDFQGYVSVPAGAYTLNLTPADDNSTVVVSYQADLSGAGGLAATVFASGFFDGTDPAFQVWVALPDGTTFPLQLATNVRTLTDQLGYYRVAPNPASSMVQVSYELSEKLDLQLTLFDANGRLLQLRNLGEQLPGEYTEELNVAQLPEGVYFLNLVSSQGVANQRIIVTK